MQNDQEVLFVIVLSIAIFFILTCALVFFMLYFQKKKFQHVREKVELEKQNAEQIFTSRLEVQEQTFNTISEEIHDNVGQLLSLAKVQLSLLEKGETTDTLLIADIKENIGNALTDLRDIAKSLSTSRIQQLTLLQATETELQRINRSGFITCTMQVTGVEQLIPEQNKIILFRIVQESFQNTIKHANATQINITLKYFDKYFEIVIVDNGIGFETDKKELAESGLGLQNIVTRSMLIGGNATINSIVNKGTNVTLTIPYE